MTTYSKTKNNVTEDYLQYRQIDDAILCPVKNIREENNKINLIIDTPENESKWVFEKPYIWDSEDLFPRLCEKFDYNKHSFDLLEDEMVLIKNIDKDSKYPIDKNNNWELVIENPDEYQQISSSNKNEQSTNNKKYMMVFAIISIISIPILYVGWKIIYTLLRYLPLIILFVLILILIM